MRHITWLVTFATLVWGIWAPVQADIILKAEGPPSEQIEGAPGEGAPGEGAPGETLPETGTAGEELPEVIPAAPAGAGGEQVFGRSTPGTFGEAVPEAPGGFQEPEPEGAPKWPWIVAGAVAVAAAVAGFLIADADSDDADEAAEAADAAQMEAAAANMAQAAAAEEAAAAEMEAAAAAAEVEAAMAMVEMAAEEAAAMEDDAQLMELQEQLAMAQADAAAAAASAEEAANAAANPVSAFTTRLFITGTFTGPVTASPNDPTMMFTPSITFRLANGAFPGGIAGYEKSDASGAAPFGGDYSQVADNAFLIEVDDFFYTGRATVIDPRTFRLQSGRIMRATGDAGITIFNRTPGSLTRSRAPSTPGRPFLRTESRHPSSGG